MSAYPLSQTARGWMGHTEPTGDLSPPERFQKRPKEFRLDPHVSVFVVYHHSSINTPRIRKLFALTQRTGALSLKSFLLVMHSHTLSVPTARVIL